MFYLLEPLTAISERWLLEEVEATVEEGEVVYQQEERYRAETKPRIVKIPLYPFPQFHNEVVGSNHMNQSHLLLFRQVMQTMFPPSLPL